MDISLNTKIVLACTVITCVVGVIIVNVVKAMVATEEAWDRFFVSGKKVIAKAKGAFSWTGLVVGLGLGPLGFIYYTTRVVNAPVVRGSDVFMLVWFSMVTTASITMIVSVKVAAKMVNRLAVAIADAFKPLNKLDRDIEALKRSVRDL